MVNEARSNLFGVGSFMGSIYRRVESILMRISSAPHIHSLPGQASPHFVLKHLADLFVVNIEQLGNLFGTRFLGLFDFDSVRTGESPQVSQDRLRRRH